MFLSYGFLSHVCYLLDIWAIRAGKNTAGNFKFGINLIDASKPNYSRRVGMEFEHDWTEHRKPMPFTAHLIRFAAFFMAWSCRIPMIEGYHEFI